MNKKNMLIFLSVSIVLLLTQALRGADSYVEEFGITEGKPVDRGFVFLDGKYIESPYVISRKGLGLYVNDKKTERPSRHMETKPLIADVNLSQISEQERQKLFRALEATRNIYEKYLSRDNGYLFFSQGGHIKLSPYTVAYDLPSVVELLTSNKTRNEKLKELRSHNWHLHGDMELFVDSFNITGQLIPRLEQLAEELLRVEEYGSMSEAPVNKGFVFIDGKYIEAPYRIARKGLGVFLNDKMIVRPYEMPKIVFSGDTDPPTPKEINSETSIFDEVVSNYLSQKHAFLRKHKTKEEEKNIMEQVYKSLPFITEANLDEKDPRILHIKTNEGVSFAQSLVSMRGRRVEYDKASVLRRIDRQREHFQKAFEKGACYFFRKNGGRTHLSTGSLPEKLPHMVNIFRSRGTDTQKLQEIRRARINISEETVRELIRNFSASPQLEARLSELTKPQ